MKVLSPLLIITITDSNSIHQFISASQGTEKTCRVSRGGEEWTLTPTSICDGETLRGDICTCNIIIPQGRRTLGTMTMCWKATASVNGAIQVLRSNMTPPVSSHA
ncbi:hypothetical protein AFLA_000493 [Aspergillus flavus NRRL3357]|nr:hypothetical protein AFLA_000493 [Aspergillus flavus NRRL3357]